MDYIKLGNRIKEERLKLNLTQATLAEDVDLSESYIGLIERGKRIPSFDTIIKIANRLDVTIDYLSMDSLDASDDSLNNQFKQLFKSQDKQTKKRALGVFKAMLADYTKE